MSKEKNIYSPNADGLLELLRKLRSPNGCPWDRKQTSKTLANCLREECGELSEAIDLDDTDSICDEIGDVMINLLLQIVVAEEKNEFVYKDVMANAIDKLIRRHAHVFGEETANHADDVLKVWEKVKAKENKNKQERNSLMDGVSSYAGALDRAEKIQKRASTVGFDWQNDMQIIDKISEELEELKVAYQNENSLEIEDELGDLLFAVSNLARFRKKSSSEQMLNAASRKFERRFRIVEEIVKNQADDGLWENFPIEKLEEFWQIAKKIDSDSNCKNS